MQAVENEHGGYHKPVHALEAVAGADYGWSAWAFVQCLMGLALALQVLMCVEAVSAAEPKLGYCTVTSGC